MEKISDESVYKVLERQKSFYDICGFFHEAHIKKQVKNYKGRSHIQLFPFSNSKKKMIS